MIDAGKDASTDAALDVLDDYLHAPGQPDDVMMLSQLDGFLAAIAIGPEPVDPQEWMPVVWNGAEPRFENSAQAIAVRRAIFALHDDIVGAVAAGTYAPVFDRDTDDGPLPHGWAEGFMTGVGLRLDQWMALLQSEQDDTIAYPILALCTGEDGRPLLDLSPKDSDFLLVHSPDLIAQAVIDIADYWQQKNKPMPAGAVPVRTTPKVGRNDPCPCGSGRKYKKCCGG
ncbi:MAG TPA: UPF0149 family protein [Rhizomicrobium sp.]